MRLIQMSTRTLFLGAGIQSGGTTLVSWCFLQRQDMDGILDLPFDQLLDVPTIRQPYGWAKMTIASFRWRDVADYYELQNFEVRPLLIVRDVRSAYASLKRKPYGRNGTTPEDPPLRLRLLRFLRDWEEFRAHDWPILRFESLLSEPESVLRRVCSDLGLPWDPAMLHWTKSRDAMYDATRGNETFWASERAVSLQDAIASQTNHLPRLSRQELAWIEDRFASYNAALGYPAQIEPSESAAIVDMTPRFSLSCRSALFREIIDLRRELDQSPLCRGRLLAGLINAFPYPRRMLRSYRCHRLYRLERLERLQTDEEGRH